MSCSVIHLANGVLQPDTPFDMVERMVTQAAQSGHIVFHIHGGLVSETAGRAIARKLDKGYRDAGASPLFCVWEGGAIEAIVNNLRAIASEDVFGRILTWVLRIVARKGAQSAQDRAAGALPPVDLTEAERMLAQALARAAAGEGGDTDADQDDALAPRIAAPTAAASALSPAEERALEEEIARDPRLVQAVQAVSSGLRSPRDIAFEARARNANTLRGSTATLMDPDSLDRLIDRPDAAARGTVSMVALIKAVIAVAGRVIARFRNGRDHGLRATIVEEVLREFYLANVGGRVWSLMKGDTQDAFGPDPARHGGTAVLHVLDRLRAQGIAPRITLVGHSTGAVFIGHMLRKAAQIRPQGFDFQVVLLAPASTVAFSDEYLLGHCDQIAGLRIFAMQDAVERADRLVPLLYPHSLLYFVSGVVEDMVDMPILGMARFHDARAFPDAGFPRLGRVRRALAARPDSAVWSVVTGAGPGLNSAARKHGDFDDDAATMASIHHVIRQGF